MPTFNWLLEHQPIASEVLKQPSGYKSYLIADDKGSQHGDPGKHQYYRFIGGSIKMVLSAAEVNAHPPPPWLSLAAPD